MRGVARGLSAGGENRCCGDKSYLKGRRGFHPCNRLASLLRPVPKCRFPATLVRAAKPDPPCWTAGLRLGRPRKGPVREDRSGRQPRRWQKCRVRFRGFQGGGIRVERRRVLNNLRERRLHSLSEGTEPGGGEGFPAEIASPFRTDPSPLHLRGESVARDLQSAPCRARIAGVTCGAVLPCAKVRGEPARCAPHTFVDVCDEAGTPGEVHCGGCYRIGTLRVIVRYSFLARPRTRESPRYNRPRKRHPAIPKCDLKREAPAVAA
jgi:hypothetical protein